MTRALITGSFDPVTTGHMDIIRRTAKMFDKVDVIAFINPEKKYMFSNEEKLEMLIAALSGYENVSVGVDDGLVCDYAVRNNIDVIVRGIRSSRDCDYECNMAEINRKLCGIETLLLPAESKYIGLSSTLARECIKSGNCLEGIIPNEVLTMKNRPF